jgi:adenine-specific DNA methylase
VTKGELSSALDILNDTIVEQLNERKKMESEKEVDKVLISKIGEFCDLLPLLKNLGDFYSVYGAFVKRIQGEKESYLQTKALDDELSEQILK